MRARRDAGRVAGGVAMAWIRTISPEAATGRLGELYADFLRNPHFMGRVPNVVQAFSQRPELLEPIARVATTATFGGSRLSRVQEEMIATVVSAINRCHY
jgi:alkylhydroperoxidase family enzyme